MSNTNHGLDGHVTFAVEKLDIILQWLDAFRCFEKHGANLLQRQSDTRTWLPETDEYKAWLASENSFLWLQGKGLVPETRRSSPHLLGMITAGSGKSVLVCVHSSSLIMILSWTAVHP